MAHDPPANPPAPPRPRVAVVGATGKLGRTLIGLLLDGGAATLAGAVARRGHPALGQDAGTWAGGRSVGIPLTDALPEGIDVVVDFSTVEGSRATLASCRVRRLPLVLGTTGLTEDLLRDLGAAATEIPLMWEPNFSLGVRLLLRLVREAARALAGRADVEILEAHHHEKRDAPSGTARALFAEVVAGGAGRTLVAGRPEGSERRRPGDVGVHSMRLGDVTGEHEVWFALPDERIELCHRARSRTAFARGALAAACFLHRKPPGRYHLDAVLGLA